MKNNLYFDADFNFLLLECEESTANTIGIIWHTNDAANQRFEIAVDGGTPTTKNLPSTANIDFDISQEYWADNGETTITAKNADGLDETITIVFHEITTGGAALNYISDTEFEIAQQEESAGGSSTPGGGTIYGGSDFVEIIRNIGFRLLDEPTDVNIYWDDATGEIKIRWTDPDDITTSAPVPATWAGTVVVRKEGSAPLHRWDGVLIKNSTTRNEHQTTPLTDSTAEYQKNYYYGIFPYDTRGDYRYTKVVALNSSSVTRNVVNIEAASGTLNNTVGNYPPVSVYGTFPSYQQEDQSFYFDTQTYLWRYTNGNVTRREFETCRLIHVEFEAKLLSTAVGEYSNISYQIRPKGDDIGNYKLIQAVAASGYFTTAQPLLRLNNYTVNSEAKNPLYFNPNQYHKVVIDIDIDNLTVTHFKCLLDGSLYAEETMSTPLNVQNDEYTYYFECTDHSYLKNINVRIE